MLSCALRVQDVRSASVLAIRLPTVAAAAFIERGAVLARLAVTLVDLAPGFLDAGRWRLRPVLGARQVAGRAGEEMRRELLANAFAPSPIGGGPRRCCIEDDLLDTFGS